MSLRQRLGRRVAPSPFGPSPFGPSKILAIAIVLCLVAAGTVALTGSDETKAVAYFSSAMGLYEGDEVRVLGMMVGEIDSIRPDGDQVRVELHYDPRHQVPADARAVIMSTAVVASRYIELTPAYTSGPVLADGAVIPRDRTAVPVEYDDVKDQLNELTAALGPDGANKTGALGRLLDTGAKYRGQGGEVRHTIEQLSRAMQTISDNRGDFFATIRNLQTFISALAASDKQIVQVIQRLDSVSGVLDDNSDELAEAVERLGKAAGSAEKFLRDHGSDATRATEKLSEVMRIVSGQRAGLEHALHAAPNTLFNFYNTYDPRGGAFSIGVNVANMQSPGEFVCGMVGAAADVGAVKAAEKCKKEFGPLLELLQMNYPPVSANPTLPGGGN